MRTALGVIFLSVQVVLVLTSQFTESRWFNWAPHSTQIWYELDVVVEGRRLSPADVERRYGLRQTGWEAHALQNLEDILIQHARTYGRGEDATVTLRYRVNGRPVETWTWQQPAPAR